MKVGSLVNFHTTVNAWRIEYLPRNPGVVLSINDTISPPLGSSRPSARVLWLNGEVTTEHITYLTVINE